MSLDKIKYYDFDGYRLDIDNCLLLKNDKRILLTPKSIQILIFLVHNRGKKLKKSEIINNVWKKTFVGKPNLYQHIYLIRKVLKSNHIHIETIPKQGYRCTIRIEKTIFKSPVCSYNKIDKKLIIEPKECSLSKTKFFKSYFKAKETAKILIKLFTFLLFIGLTLQISLSKPNHYFFKKTKPTTYKSIAVFPFIYVGKEKNENVEIDVAKRTLSQLVNSGKYSLIPLEHTTIYTKKNFKKSEQSLLKSGSNIGADIILTGTIQIEDDHARYSIICFSVKNKKYLSIIKFDEKLNNIFKLQESISEKAAKSLLLELKK